VSPLFSRGPSLSLSSMAVVEDPVAGTGQSPPSVLSLRSGMVNRSRISLIKVWFGVRSNTSPPPEGPVQLCELVPKSVFGRWSNDVLDHRLKWPRRVPCNVTVGI
jgi:hypothetical protein